MNLEIIELGHNNFLVFGEQKSFIAHAHSLELLAMFLNILVKNNGCPHDIYRAAIDRDRASDSYGKSVLLILLPAGHYERVMTSSC